MAMPLDLVLIRHGESVGNAAIRDAKAGLPMPPADDQQSTRLWLLNATGERQAEATGAWMRENGLDRFDRYYCSPYVRTTQTAALLRLPDASWWLEPLLRERDRGYEYLANRELAGVFPHSARGRKHDIFLWRPTAGESIADVDLRLRGSSPRSHANWTANGSSASPTRTRWTHCASGSRR
ncbi:MAG TPA: phosphoglycerate mutase family protein [Acidimicrobiales bacterium]|jgi:broad specificity phosphatase PhoE